MQERRKPIVGIIGGKGKMGKWFSKFFRKTGRIVIISDLGTKFSNRYIAQKADITIISVPIKETKKVIREIRSFVRREALLADFTSLKEIPLHEMKKGKSGVLGMHPLFNQLAKNLKGQTVVFCRGRENKWIPYLERLFKKNKARVSYMNAKTHDYHSAYMQVLTHFTNIAFAHALSWGKYFPKMSFMTPVSKLHSIVLGRIFSQNPELYAGIEIENPEFRRVLKGFLSSAHSLAKSVEKKDYKKFERAFSKTRGPYKNFIPLAKNKISNLIDIIET